MKATTRNWLDKVARLNGVKRSEVLKYIKNLSSSKKVIHHLRLAQ